MAKSEGAHVSRARLTQIMDLNLLAPDIQEEILFLEKSNRTYVTMNERDVRKIAKIPDWNTQRCRWRTSQ